MQAVASERTGTVDPEWDHPRHPTVEDYAFSVAVGDPRWACNTCTATFDAADDPAWADATAAERRAMAAANYLRAHAHMKACSRTSRPDHNQQEGTR